MSDPLSALRAVGGTEPTQSAGLPNIPAVPFTDDMALANFLQSAKLWMEKAKGEGLTGFATKADLVRNGVLAADENGNIIPGTGGGEAPNLAIPPVATGLTASGAMTSILVQWDDPTLAYDNHGYTEVWAAETDDFTGAVMIGESGGFLFSHAVGEDATRYYWVRFVSTAGIKGPYNAVGGTMGVTSKNAAYLLSVLTGELGEQPFYELTVDTEINGVLVPAGVYMKTAYIADASITNAKIGNLSADKITSGQITAERIDGTNLKVLDGEFTGSINCGSGKFLVTNDGTMRAENAFVKADITGSTGTFFGRLAAGVLDDGAFSGQATEYKTPGTYTITVPNRSDWTSVSCRVTLQAGGGGGGGGSGDDGNWYMGAGGGGGGAGASRTETIHNLTPGAAMTLEVGAGGTGGSIYGYNGTAGASGGATSFAGYSAAGGVGGGGASAQTGGAGGVSGGKNGELPAGGAGGASLYAAGGAGGQANGASGSGGGIGAGGGGGAGMHNNPVPFGRNGGNGGPGYALIEFFDPNLLVRKKEFNDFKGTVSLIGHTHDYAPTTAFVSATAWESGYYKSGMWYETGITYRFTRANGSTVDVTAAYGD